MTEISEHYLHLCYQTGNIPGFSWNGSRDQKVQSKYDAAGNGASGYRDFRGSGARGPGALPKGPGFHRRAGSARRRDFPECESPLYSLESWALTQGKVAKYLQARLRMLTKGSAPKEVTQLGGHGLRHIAKIPGGLSDQRILV